MSRSVSFPLTAISETSSTGLKSSLKRPLESTSLPHGGRNSPGPSRVADHSKDAQGFRFSEDFDAPFNDNVCGIMCSSHMNAHPSEQVEGSRSSSWVLVPSQPSKPSAREDGAPSSIPYNEDPSTRAGVDTTIIESDHYPQWRGEERKEFLTDMSKWVSVLDQKHEEYSTQYLSLFSRIRRFFGLRSQRRFLEQIQRLRETLDALFERCKKAGTYCEVRHSDQYRALKPAVDNWIRRATQVVDAVDPGDTLSSRKQVMVSMEGDIRDLGEEVEVLSGKIDEVSEVLKQQEEAKRNRR